MVFLSPAVGRTEYKESITGMEGISSAGRQVISCRGQQDVGSRLDSCIHLPDDK